MPFKKCLLAMTGLAFAVAAAAAPVNVNTADKATLTSLDGVGEVLAERIIEEREASGPYSDAEDLTQRIRGLGDAFIENNAEDLRFESGE
ncbi:ComEA family DNA-binding protein [Algiphilus sp.]|uniref:ComEA family DNA-binding protein n=1 Tax=Algiphilus sp. TaxID=1872431 RepID=UPI003B52D0FE